MFKFWTENHIPMKNQLIYLILLLLPVTGLSQNYTADWESINSRPVPEWFSDVKFGIFIHWGVYSVPAWAPADADIGVYAKYSEWYWFRMMNTNDKAGQLFREHHNKMYGEDFLYQDFAPKFRAEYFEPTQWAELFKKAGAKYVVLTSKHHEGFTLWPSAQSWNWNSVDIGAKRDLCGDLSDAVKEAGLHMGFYYSLYEWYNPLYRNNLDKYVDDHMIPQLKDLVNRYKPDLVWTDGEWDHPSEKWKSTEFLAWLYNESPVKETVTVNDRWGKETRGVHGGFYTTEYDMVHDGTSVSNPDHPWEECRGIGTSFGYNRIETPAHYMSSEALVHLLVDKVSAGGNLLLDVGPTADGRIPEIQQQRLLDIGKWLEVNGDAIYGTRKWDGAKDSQSPDYVRFTKRGNDLYVICKQFPAKSVVVKGVSKSGKVSLLGYEGGIKSKISGGSLTITVPDITPANSPCDHAWVFRVENAF